MVTCPYCGKPTLKGTLIGGPRALRWRPDDQKMLLGLFKCGGLRIGSHVPMQNAAAVTWYCSYCRKLIIDIDDC